MKGRSYRMPPPSPAPRTPARARPAGPLPGSSAGARAPNSPRSRAGPLRARSGGAEQRRPDEGRHDGGDEEERERQRARAARGGSGRPRSSGSASPGRPSPTPPRPCAPPPRTGSEDGTGESGKEEGAKSVEPTRGRSFERQRPSPKVPAPRPEGSIEPGGGKGLSSRSHGHEARRVPLVRFRQEPPRLRPVRLLRREDRRVGREGQGVGRPRSPDAAGGPRPQVAVHLARGAARAHRRARLRPPRS